MRAFPPPAATARFATLSRGAVFRRVRPAVAAVLVAALAAAGLFALHARAAARTEALLVLGRAAGDAERLRTLDWQAVAEGKLTEQERSRRNDARHSLLQAVGVLRGVDRGDARVDTLDLRVKEFIAATTAETEVVLAGDVGAARSVVATRVVPSVAALDASLDALRRRYIAEAARADLTMVVAAALALLVAAGLVGLLSWRKAAVQRAAMLVQVQERVLRENEVRFRSLVQHSSDVISVVDSEWRVLYCSPAALPLLGFSPEEMEGVRILDLVHEEDSRKAETFARELANARGETRAMVWRLRHASGAWLDVETVATNLLGDPVMAGIVLNTRDVSERVALETRLTYQASHDGLTNLANRTLFRQRVERSLERGDARQQGSVVLFLDLDEFKAVNDALGHDQGDRLLAEAAERFLSATRGRDLVARFGGDEFAILLENVHDVRGAVRVAERIAQALREPFRLAGREVFVTSSIGIACAEPGMGADDLLRNADVAMYAAKNRGKGRFEVFHAEMHQSLLSRMELEEDLRDAIEEGRIEVAYLPLVDLETGVLRGVEALARWNHPARGPIAPAVFVPIAEETGLILALGRHVLETACRTVAGWQAQLAVDGTLSINVNVSPRQLLDPAFVEVVRTAIVETGVAPGTLALEITEGSLLASSDALRERLERLRALGVSLVLDDFGTGYASLSNLHRFSVDAIKVDRTFVARVAEGGVPAAIAAAVLSFGRALGLRTVAEGVETPAQMSQLRSLGCDDAQGFLFAPPLDAVAMDAWLREQRIVGAVDAVLS